MRRMGLCAYFFLGFIVSLATGFSGGSGTESDPYHISTAQDLIDIGTSLAHYDKHFILMEDIDLSGQVFDKAMIAPNTGQSTSGYSSFEPDWFRGTIDGNHHVIQNMTIEGTVQLGLVGRMGERARIYSLGLVQINITGTGDDIGGFAGSNFLGTLDDCYCTGSIQGRDSVGGLIGFNSGKIINSYSTSAIDGHSQVGGLVGYQSGYIQTCYSSCTVNGSSYVGGLVGRAAFFALSLLYESYPEGIVSCYSDGVTHGNYQVGGLAGNNQTRIDSCYSTCMVSGRGDIGGLVGLNAGTVAHSVWDTQASGLSISDGGVGLTTADMMNARWLAFNGFAFDPNWILADGQDYPRLAWEEAREGTVIAPTTIDWIEGSGTLSDPYRIETAAQLRVLGKCSILWEACFVLTRDIDLGPGRLESEAFSQAVIPWFAGYFDGQGHVIRHLEIIGGNHLGLFGILSEGARVTSLGVEELFIYASGGNIGGLAGSSSAFIFNSYATGKIESDGDGVGGLVGSNRGEVVKCRGSVRVRGHNSVGGIIGSNYQGLVSVSFFGEEWIYGEDEIGGLVGRNNNGVLTNCYCKGWVDGTDNVGGLIGYHMSGSSVTHCYSTITVTGEDHVGGLVGGADLLGSRDVAETVIGFWDIDRSGTSVSAGGTGLTHANMNDVTSYLEAGWDFVDETSRGTANIWTMPETPGPPVFSKPIAMPGDGTKASPFLITTAEQLGAIWFRPFADYRLNADLDLEGIHWASAVIPCFSGRFDGNGYWINHLHITGGSDLGLFGHLLTDASAYGVNLNQVSITSTGRRIGALAAQNNASIYSCQSMGQIEGDYTVGGLVGNNYQNGSLVNCLSLVDVNTARSYVGGLVADNAGLIRHCYSAGRVQDSLYDTGGLIGDLRSLFGVVDASFWDVETSGQTTSAGGTGLTTEQMQTPSTFLNAGWDFVDETANGTEDIWQMIEPGYPQLVQKQQVPVSPIQLIPLESMVATDDDGLIQSINGIERLYTGTTLFLDAPIWPIFPAASADDLDLMTLAVTDGQVAVQTQFDAPMDSVIILTRDLPTPSLIQLIGQDGEVLSDPVVLDANSFSETDYTSLGRTVYGVEIRYDTRFYGISLSPVGDYLLGIDIVSVLGIQHWASQVQLGMVTGFSATGDDGAILSIEGLSVDDLILGSTSFPQPAEWPIFPPEDADDFDLSTLASTENQSSFTTEFAEPVTEVYLIIRPYLGNNVGVVEQLDAQGEVLGDSVSFGPESFSSLGVLSYGREIQGLKISGDGYFSGIRVRVQEDHPLVLDPVCICGIPVEQ